MPPQPITRRYFVRGRVQGVGFRQFVLRQAKTLGIRGYTRNLDDGRVEVYAIGGELQLSEFEGLIAKGPTWCDVRGVETHEAALLNYKSFLIEG